MRRTLRANRTLSRGCGQMRHVGHAWVFFWRFYEVKRRVFKVGMVSGSQGSPDRSPGEIWIALGALWGHVWGTTLDQQMV